MNFCSARALSATVMTRIRACAVSHSDGSDRTREVCFTDIQHRTAYHCSAEASFDSCLVLRQRLKHVSEKSRVIVMGMPKKIHRFRVLIRHFSREKRDQKLQVLRKDG